MFPNLSNPADVADAVVPENAIAAYAVAVNEVAVPEALVLIAHRASFPS
jgi:hypothetical protein